MSDVHEMRYTVKADTYSARTEKCVLSPRAARKEWRHWVLAALVGEFSQLVLHTSSGHNIFLMSCPRTIVWLVNLKWAWLVRFPPWRVTCAAVGGALWGLPRSSALEFLVKYEMSWPPERTLFLFLPPRENEHISLFLRSMYQPLCGSQHQLLTEEATSVSSSWLQSVSEKSLGHREKNATGHSRVECSQTG